MSQDSLRIVLVGKTGVGKSATGNTILGEKVFNSEARATSITKHCSSRKQVINGRAVFVVDTPGLYDTTLSNDEVIDEVVKCITYAAPGPHVFLLVMSIGRFTEEERNTVKLIQEVFGTDAKKHMMILFTKADDLEEDRTLEEFIDEDPELSKVIRACKGGYHAFNNREKSDRTQVEELLRKIGVMLKHNQNSYYIYHMFEMAKELNSAKKNQMEKDEIIAELKDELKQLQKNYSQNKSSQNKHSSPCTIL